MILIIIVTTAAAAAATTLTNLITAEITADFEI